MLLKGHDLKIGTHYGLYVRWPWAKFSSWKGTRRAGAQGHTHSSAVRAAQWDFKSACLKAAVPDSFSSSFVKF